MHDIEKAQGLLGAPFTDTTVKHGAGYTVEAVILAGAVYALDRHVDSLTTDDYHTLGYIAGLGRPPTGDEIVEARAIVGLFQDGAEHIAGARQMVAPRETVDGR